MQANQLICPKCHTGLLPDTREGDNTCPVCRYRYTLQEGLFDFSPDNHFYWGEISQQEMQEVNTQAQRNGWFQAFISLTHRFQKREMAKYLLDPVRIAGMFHFYNPQRRGVCVDLGSGWGPLSFGLSQFYDKVYSVDGVYERLRFQATRAIQEQVSNITFLKSSMLTLPLQNGIADTIIVNGLLEWIGLSDETTPPRELQLHFLREVHRILKPGGSLYIGIENRTGAQFFLGSRDHSGLKYTSLMPRWMASRVVARARRMDDASFFSGAEHSYRTLTYTYWGYQQLLREAGFPPAKMYWTWPSYNDPQVSGTLDGSSIAYYLHSLSAEIPDVKRRTVLNAVKRLPRLLLGWLIRIFSPHFLILTAKGKVEGSLQDNVVGKSRHTSLLRTSTASAGGLDSDFIVLNGNGARKKVHLLCKACGPGRGEVLEVGEREEVQGRPMLLSERGQVVKVAEWLGQFQQKESRGEWNLADLRQQLDLLVETAAALYPEAGSQLNDYREMTLSDLANCKIQRVTEHGCLTPQNIHIQPGGSLRVTGWKQSTSAGHPWMDAGTFLAAIPDNHLAARRAFEQEYTRWMDLPIHLAPTYAVLRVLQQHFVDKSINPQNYLILEHWSPRLKSALKYSLQTQPVFPHRSTHLSHPG